MSNPQKSISTAIRACFYRIIILYCGSIFLIGLIVPANSPMLLTANKHSANANASPFVVASTSIFGDLHRRVLTSSQSSRDQGAAQHVSRMVKCVERADR
jgi:amino acid permease